MIHHFSGRSILVAEDDYYLAMDVKAALLAIGVRPLGPAPDPEKRCCSSARPTLQ